MEEIYRIALGLLNGVGAMKSKLLVSYTGGLEAVFKESDIKLGKIDGIGSWLARNMDRKSALLKAESELRFIEKHNIQTYFYQDQNYPAKLNACPDGPVCLFTKGKVEFAEKSIAIVGTRKSTPYGRKMVEKLVGDFEGTGIQIVSGLAHGIDKCAHQASLNQELSTLAVLGHGLDMIYPAANRTLAKNMLETGGLVTEYVSGIHGDPANFPARNRIVAGLCDATIVVESSEKGGSLITANLANDYDREVFAVPGNAMAEQSKGCNNLIRRDIARLITSGTEVMDYLGWDGGNQKPSKQIELFDQMSEEEKQIIKIFQDKGQINIDNLTDESQMPIGLLSMHLFNLEIKGLIKSLPGKVFGMV